MNHHSQAIGIARYNGTVTIASFDLNTGAIADISGLFGAYDYVYGENINDQGDIVGSLAARSGGGGGAFLLKNGVVSLLSDCIAPGLTLNGKLVSLDRATAINNVGQILCASHLNSIFLKGA